MKIVRLQAENIKRIKAVEITPAGELVVIGGKNDAGKSSLLDAIEMAMGGETRTPAQPVRRGQKRGKVVLDLGDKVVSRSYGADGSRKLVVTSKDGARFPSPQALLDSLYGSLSFDPLAFERMEPRAQAETLRRMVGLDTSDLDAARDRLYAERTEANRAVRTAEVQAEGVQRYADAPDEEVSIAGLAGELERAEAARREASAASEKAQAAARDHVREAERVGKLKEQIADLRARLAGLEQEVEQAEGGTIPSLVSRALAAAEAAQTADLRVPDTADIRRRLMQAEETNRKVRANREHAKVARQVEAARTASRRLTDRIADIDAQRTARLAAVTFPVPGLSVDEDGVLLDGLPFDQASTSDRIRVSVAIGLAANPKLRVLLVRDGSLLGPDKVKILAEMAAKADAQVWLEMLQEAPDASTTVYIEDGSVRPSGGEKSPQVEEQAF